MAVLAASTVLIVWVPLGSPGAKVAYQRSSARLLAKVVARTVSARSKLVWTNHGTLPRALREPAPLVVAVKRSALEQVEGHLAATHAVRLGDGGTHVLYAKEASAAKEPAD